MFDRYIERKYYSTIRINQTILKLKKKNTKVMIYNEYILYTYRTDRTDSFTLNTYIIYNNIIIFIIFNTKHRSDIRNL